MPASICTGFIALAVTISLFSTTIISTREDLIRAALEKTKAEYHSKTEKAGTIFIGKLDERIKTVAESGNLDGVLELRADKKAFETDGTAPKSKLMKTAYGDYQDAVKAARKTMSEAYELAIKEYTKKLDTDLAEEVRNDFLAFRTGKPKVVPGPLPKAGQEATWEIAPNVKMTFCWIPPGVVQLGAWKQEQIELARIMPGGKRQDWMDAESEQSRPIYKSIGFWLGKYEVTQAEWEGVMGANPSAFDGKKANKAKGQNTSRFPVDSVSWDDCQDFFKKVNEHTGVIEKALGTRVRLNLPHENEWEYACRGGKGNGWPFHFGAVLDGKQANCNGTVPWGVAAAGPSLGRTATVGSYAKDYPHPWGLADMHGNIAEWCENKYAVGEEARVLRGGNWASPAWECRSAARFRAKPGSIGDRGGLRVCVRAQ